MRFIGENILFPVLKFIAFDLKFLILFVLRIYEIKILLFSYHYIYFFSVQKAAKHGNKRSTQAAKLFALVSLLLLFL